MEPANAPKLAHPLNGREILNVFIRTRTGHAACPPSTSPAQNRPIFFTFARNGRIRVL